VQRSLCFHIVFIVWFNNKIVKFIDKVSGTGEKPIIIIQADEGASDLLLKISIIQILMK